MAIKNYKPTSPGRRNMSVASFDGLTKTKPERSLVAPLNQKGGRNNKGRLTVRHRGGGHKRRYRVIDFRRDKFDIVGRVATIEYDPNRSARIALIVYEDGERRYSGAGGGQRGRHSDVGTECRSASWQRVADSRDSSGHDDPQYRAVSGARRAARSQRRKRGPTCGKGRRYGAGSPAEWRSSLHRYE